MRDQVGADQRPDSAPIPRRRGCHDHAEFALGAEFWPGGVVDRELEADGWPPGLPPSHTERAWQQGRFPSGSVSAAALPQGAECFV